MCYPYYIWSNIRRGAVSKMRIIAFRCNACGADLQFEDDKKEMYCPYCGTRLALDDDNIEITNRIVDEARLKEAEIRLRELEYAHERELRLEEIREKQKKTHRMYIGIFILAALVSFVFFREYFFGAIVIGAIVLGIMGTSDKRVPDKKYGASSSKKSRMIALVLCILLGEFGFHYFYVGKIGAGILYLCTFGLFGFGWLVDIVRIAVGTFRDKNGYILE